MGNGNVKIGTSGFSFRDWLGEVYPKDLKKGEELLYYSQHLGFEAVEINSTYYGLYSERSFQGMEAKTPAGFEFAVKGYKGFTHEPFDDRLGSGKPSRKKAREDAERFRASLRPLEEKGKLACVLLQFPVFFPPGPESQEYLLECRAWLKGLPLAVEFRNRAWAREATWTWLKENDLANCAVDEPRLPRLMPFEPRVTAEPAYFRFHGRNPNWFNAPVELRYDYFYSEEELQGFVPHIREASAEAGKVLVFFNNCHRGSALKNAGTLRELLGQPSPVLHPQGELF